MFDREVSCVFTGKMATTRYICVLSQKRTIGKEIKGMRKKHGKLRKLPFPILQGQLVASFYLLIIRSDYRGGTKIDA